ncbi:MAG: ABC transporter substrate binding protein [Desulfobacteraceae bacterium]
MKKHLFQTAMPVILFFFLMPVQCTFGSPEKALKRVFVVHSYEKNHVCGQPQHDGVMKALEDAGWRPGENMDTAVHYMDTKRKNNTPELIEKQARTARKKIKQYNPDLVVTLDDNAFRTVALPMAGDDTPVVFSGMNGQPEDYNRTKRFMANREHPGHNITGIYEKLHIRQAIRVLSNLLDINKVLILDDLSPTGKAISRQVSIELDSSAEGGDIPCETVNRTINSWEEYQSVIRMINESPEIDSFYLGTLLLKDSDGETHTAPEIIDYTVKNAEKPAIGLNYAFIKMGLYGGASVDFFEMGYQAGQKAAAILGGADPGTLAVEDAKRVALVFNLSRAEALGLDIPKDILLAADEVFRK